jgi:hypothetical protein
MAEGEALLEPSSHEEVPLVESTALLLTYPDPSFELSPELEIMEEEEIQPPDFPFEFEEDLFENFGNTSNYPHEKRPPVSLNPIDPLDKASLKDVIRGLTSVLSSKWGQEGEHSSEAIQVQTPSLTIPCFIQGTAVSTLYNPVVGVNIISSSFALSHLSENPVLPTTRTLRTRPRSIIEGTKVMHDMPVWHEKAEIALDFDVFEVHDFDILIGHLIEKLFLDVSALGTLDITLAGRSYTLPITQSKNSLA